MKRLIVKAIDAFLIFPSKGNFNISKFCAKIKMSCIKVLHAVTFLPVATLLFFSQEHGRTSKLSGL